VVGSGISGLSAAWLLAQAHDVTLYEAEPRPGGHSNTVNLPASLAGVPVDTGFIVYNERTYPNLTALFRHLGVETQASEMSFAVSARRGAVEYSGSGLAGLFAQRRNLVRPRFWRMVQDVLRFYREAEALLASGIEDGRSLGAYLAAGGYGEAFIAEHLLPMGAAIWSCPPEAMRDFPIDAFLRFFRNHGLLQIKDRPLWRTVSGGSRNYVAALLGAGITRRFGCPVVAVRRGPLGPEVFDGAGAARSYDHVVLATHSDQALRLLAQPTAQERALLGDIRYQRNTAVLHTDPALMPRRRRAWSSWNVTDTERADRPVAVTYWMNRLQRLPIDRDVFVTLNPRLEPRPALNIATFDYAHPLFDAAALRAQRSLWNLQGQGGVWFCGAYFGSGFHEDGLQAGLAVAEAIGGVRRPWSVADESGRIHLGPVDVPAVSRAVAA
jgi:predicted NAD/FAD-binding protein